MAAHEWADAVLLHRQYETLTTEKKEAFQKNHFAPGAMRHSCANLNIHMPSAIQGHGYLLVMDKDTYVITQVSGNVTALGYTYEDLLGKELSEVIERSMIVDLEKIPLNVRQFKPMVSFQVEFGVGELRCQFTAHHHVRGKWGFLELERQVVLNASGLFELNVLVRTFSQQLAEVEEVLDACQLLTQVVQASTGYDRVMVYMFHPDDHGEVVAESLSRTSMATSFKGLHFPAYDIPDQARACFVRNSYTHQPHVKHHEVPLVPTECSLHKERPDMTLVTLRAPAPGCTQYYLNLGVMSCIVVSILVNGRLWGLLVCHSFMPKFIAFDQRVAMVMTVEVLALFIKKNEGEIVKEAHETARPARQRILKMLEEGSGLQAAIASPQRNILDVMECTGAAVVLGLKVYRFGTTPTSDQILKMVEWVSQERDGVLSATDLSEEWTGARGFVEPALGCLVQSNRTSSAADLVVLVWFRMPSSEQVAWGGDPASSYTATGMVARADFTPFVQSTTIPPKPWNEAERHVAVQIMEDFGLQLAVSRQGQKALDLKDQLLDTIPTELQTPLYVVNGLVEVCLEAPHVPEDLRSHLEMIHHSGTAMQGLLNNVTEVQTLEGARPTAKVELQDVNLVELSRACLKTFGAQFAAKGVQGRLVFNYDLEQVTLGLDKARQQLLQANLISNALKFTSEGTITVQLAYNQNLRELRVSVVDTGVSIPKEDIPRAFDKPTEAGGPAFRSRVGHLGLYIVKQTVTTLGGKAGVSPSVSPSGETGCTFWFTLPALWQHNDDGPSQFSLLESSELCTETVCPLRTRAFSLSPTHSELELLPRHLRERDGSMSRSKRGTASVCSTIANAFRDTFWSKSSSLDMRTNTMQSLTGTFGARSSLSRNPAPTSVRPKYREKILVAESDAIARQATCRVLQSVAQCDAVGDGDEVLAKLTQFSRYKLILMDLHMPNMSGIDATRAVRSMAKYNHIPIVGFTASIDPGETQDCKEAGMADVILKNVPKAELQSIIHTYMDARPP